MVGKRSSVAGPIGVKETAQHATVERRNARFFLLKLTLSRALWMRIEPAIGQKRDGASENHLADIKVTHHYPSYVWLDSCEKISALLLDWKELPRSYSRLRRTTIRALPDTASL